MGSFQYKFKSTWFIFLCILLLSYFLLNTINGDRGLLKYLYLKKEISETQKIATKIHLEKIKLDDKVKSLSSSSLDLDMLDERARAVLRLVDHEEYIIIDNRDVK